MDRQARRFNTQRDDGSDGASDNASGNESENIEGGDSNNNNNNNSTNNNGVSDKKTRCDNCAANFGGDSHWTSKGTLCKTCYQFWRRTGMMRNVPSARKHEPPGSTRHNPIKSKRKPPRGMFINVQDLMSMVNGPPGQGEAFLRGLNAEIVNLKRNVQALKAQISQYKTETSPLKELKRLEIPSSQRINPRWTNEEQLLAVQGVRKHGKDFKAIAEIIGTKTESHVRQFFVNHERKYNLKRVLAEYEAENGINDTSSQDSRSLT